MAEYSIDNIDPNSPRGDVGQNGGDSLDPQKAPTESGNIDGVTDEGPVTENNIAPGYSAGTNIYNLNNFYNFNPVTATGSILDKGHLGLINAGGMNTKDIPGSGVIYGKKFGDQRDKSLSYTMEFGEKSFPDILYSKQIVTSSVLPMPEPEVIPLQTTSSAVADTCTCPFPRGGGAFTLYKIIDSTTTHTPDQLTESEEEEYFSYFKKIIEARFDNKVIVSRTGYLKFDKPSFEAYLSGCKGERVTLTNAEYKKMLAPYSIAHKFYLDSSDGYLYRKICVTLKEGVDTRDVKSSSSFKELDKIFNVYKDVNSNVITVYTMAMGQGYGVWGGSSSDMYRASDHGLGNGASHFLGMDSFNLILSNLDNDYDQLIEVGLPRNMFKHLSFVMMLHELVEAHYIQNLNHYLNETNDLDEVEIYLGISMIRRTPYTFGHVKALLVQAREVKMDDAFSQWICLNEDPEVELPFVCFANTDGAACLVTYKKVAENQYIKCTYAFRIKNSRFIHDIPTNMRTPPSDDRNWFHFGCIMFKDQSGTIMTTKSIKLTKHQYNYEIGNHKMRINNHDL